jgi:ParB-like chromosome segregation protein Spo0J
MTEKGFASSVTDTVPNVTIPVTGVVNVPIESIDVDLDWNSRSEANVNLMSVSESDEESSGLEGLMKALLAHGQDTPVDLRLTSHSFYKSTTKPYSLVAGFRRFTAISLINNNDELKKALPPGGTLIPRLPDGMIRATIRGHMSEREAFGLNARENAVRESLTPPETLGVVQRALVSYKMNVHEISALLGKSISSIRDYERVSRLPSKVIAHWKGAGEFEGIQSAKRVGWGTIVEIAKLPSDEQVAAYRAALQSQVKKIDSSVWLDKARHRAVAVGSLLAKLQKRGFATVTPGKDWLGQVDTMVRVGRRELKWKDAKTLAEAAEGAFQRELAKPLEQKAEAEEEELDSE